MYNFQKYVVEDEQYGDQFPFTIYQTNKIYEQDQNGQITQKDLVQVQIKNTETNYNIIEKLRKLKYISIIQPLHFEYADKYLNLYYPDILKYQFDQQQLKKINDKNEIWKFLLQLVLTYREFEKRKIQWPLVMLEQIYYINGQVYLCLNQYLFNYENTTNIVSLKNIIEEYFKQDDNLIKIIKQSNDVLFDLEEYLLRMCQVEKINWLNPPYEQVLALILNVMNFKNLINQGNSVIKSIPTSETLKLIYRKEEISKELIVKSTRYQSKDQEDQIEQNIDRELQHLETCSFVNNIANCYCYFRIRKYSFLIMKKYAGTVRDVLNNWPNKLSTKEEIRKQIYFFAQRFAQALLEMHSLKILHRDLKPENLFVDHLNFIEGYIYIADFDRSKQLQDIYNIQITSANCYNTQIYDPPENPKDNQSLAYDIFQYGLILLEVANLGKYVGLPCGPRFMETEVFKQHYSEENIKNILNKNIPFSPQFVEIISQCLKRNQLERPNAEELYQKINKIYLNSKIMIIQK